MFVFQQFFSKKHGFLLTYGSGFSVSKLYFHGIYCHIVMQDFTVTRNGKPLGVFWVDPSDTNFQFYFEKSMKGFLTYAGKPLGLAQIKGDGV